MSQFIEISQLVVRERQCRVRQLTDQLRDCFHADATVTTSWLKGSAAAFVSGGPARAGGSREPIINRLGPPLVYESGRRAVVELPSTTIRWTPVNGVEAELASFMRLLYRVEQRAGVWRISDLTAINEGDTLTPAVPATDLQVDPEAAAGFRHSYRFLAYTRSLDGETVSPDLYGIDRPDDVTALYDEAFAWSAQQPAETVAEA